MSQVRVRFAPSPTGSFHLGSARTALFNWLYARHTDGTFILRVEDTDRERNTPEALDVLLKGMRWLGLDWDEGPEVGGDYGPYFQSQRGAIYNEYIEKLFDVGRAYEKDSAVFFKLEGERYTEYDEYKKENLEKVRAKPQIIEDAVRGQVVRAEERDFVIVRSNGEPVFHLVNVVDDITMGITHIIRGEDHLSNTTKHCELFQALGAPLPKFAHIPMILSSTGPGKMSKRGDGVHVEDYEKNHFLPHGLVNFLALLGWNAKDDQELFSLEELIERFELSGIQKGNARFDEKKLAHINTEQIRRLSSERFIELALPVLQKAGVDVSDSEYTFAVLKLSQEKTRSLVELPEFVAYFFDDAFGFDETAGERIFKKGEPLDRLAEVKQALSEVVDWNAESLDQAFLGLAVSQGQEKPFAWFPITRFAVSGVAGGPDLIPMLAMMGKDRVLGRMDRFPSRYSA
ncbi:MAG: glutamate--tRNA ligase family protein [Verrucomicrobia bacterium]|nr:glutamate--tRNA ligase family protein [Verrucomicrobiota bacterium]MDA1068713.1 glutamate--tRNA ligase family protein [Verrucomicrobiota bacterium]